LDGDTGMTTTFDKSRARKFVLETVDFRTPQHGDLYIDKKGMVQRKVGHNYSRRAQQRPILKETWTDVQCGYCGGIGTYDWNGKTLRCLTCEGTGKV